MKMKSKYVAGCLLASAGALSYAQSSNVTLYGVLDTGVEHVTNVGAAGKGLTRMPTLTGSVASRWGMRGSEDLGGGQKAIFTLESGFGLDTGVSGQGGRLFGRQGFVGVAGAWGSLTLGRQYTMLVASIADTDILGPNIYGSGSVDSYIPNARADNAIAYRGTFNGLTLGATYSLGRDTVGNCAGENAADKRACREWSALAKYDADGWGVALARDEISGGPGAAAGLTSSALTDTRTVLNGYVKFGKAKIGSGVIRRNNEGSATSKSDMVYLGAAYPLTPALVLDAQLYKLDYKNSPNQSTLLAVRGTYGLSKRTVAYVTAGHMQNGGTSALSVSTGAAGSNPAAGASQTGFMVGMRHNF